MFRVWVLGLLHPGDGLNELLGWMGGENLPCLGFEV